MRISDWSSDVCSSDLRIRYRGAIRHRRLAMKPLLPLLSLIVAAMLVAGCANGDHSPGPPHPGAVNPYRSGGFHDAGPNYPDPGRQAPRLPAARHLDERPGGVAVFVRGQPQHVRSEDRRGGNRSVTTF